MNYVNLKDMIDALTERTKLNICITFFDDHGNESTYLPRENTIHGKPYCDYMKSTAEGFKKCFKCRTLAIKKAQEKRISFGGFCFNGIYEYCHPVIEKDCVIAVIMIGNIHMGKNHSEPSEITLYKDSIEDNFTEEKCKRICSILDTHIKLLIKNAPNKKEEYSPLIHNICNYIEEVLYSDISVSTIAAAFGYSDKHIGRLFKSKTGLTIHEYVNDKRLVKAQMLLENTHDSITEISSKCGFNNLTYFNRIFKKRYTITPGEFRKEKTKKKQPT